MKLYRLKYKEKTFNYKNRLIRLTNEITYPEDHDIYKKFKSHFIFDSEVEDGNETESNPTILLEDPVEDAKVIIEDEKVSTEVKTEDETEDETEGDTIDLEEDDVVVDYNTLETKEELIQYIKDNELDVVVGNTKSVDKIKAKIKDSLEK